MQKILDIIFYSAGVVLGIVVAVYFYFFLARYARMYIEYKSITPTKKQKVVFKVVQIVFCLALGIPSCFISYLPALIIGHFLAFLLIFDGVFFVVKLALKKHPKGLRIAGIVHHSNILPVIVCVALLVFGAVNMTTIHATNYSFSSAKITKQDYSIVLITDSHVGEVQDREVFYNALSEIDALSPDILVLGGDIVDENTSKEDMQEVLARIGDIDTTYGIYFVYGNHDKQLYATGTPNFSDQELVDNLATNGITILCDESVVINGEVLLIGRQDESNVTGDRVETATLASGYNLDDYYTVLVDHQPEREEFKKASQAKVDLQLSGHTHAGQIFPTGLFLKVIGTPNYGQYDVDDFSAIVSSGITGWGYPFRTEGICEYVVINIMAE